MATYPKKKSGTSRTRRQPIPSKKPVWMGILLAFLSGYLLAWFYSPVALQSLFQIKQSKQLIAQPTANLAVLPKPKFEFYTLLTQEKAATPIQSKPAVTIPVPPMNQVLKSEAVIAAQIPASKYAYIVQLASFQRQEDAEQMKAALIMRGFDAQIKTTTQQGSVWHRVVMGPFVSQQTAQKIQADIAKSERISGIIRRMDA
jgi:cell division protein FtsN